MNLEIFVIPSFRKTEVEKKLEKLARKAAKYDNPDISFTIGQPRVEVRKDSEGKKFKIEVVDVTVKGEAPKIAGWQLLARVELFGEENLVHVVPGVEQKPNKQYRTHNGHCDHCSTNRPRKDVFVLTDGEKQIAVGRSCLHDFLGIDDPKSIVHRAQFFEQLRSLQDEESDFSFSSFGFYKTRDILMLAAAFIRMNGYVSKAKQQETGYSTTGQCVHDALLGVPGAEVKHTEEDIEWAEKTVEYFRSVDSFDNDYLDNIRVILKQDIADRRHINILASAVITVQRKLAEKKKAETATSDFVGAVKQRLKNVELTLDRVIFLGSGSFGPSYLHLMSDQTGNVFSWITTNKICNAEGSTVTLDATVKQHKLYNGVKQTVLTRAKLKS